MKNLTKLFILGLVAFMIMSFTPGKEFSGTVVYNITYEMEDMDPQMAAYLPKTMKMTVKNPMSRTEISMGMGKNITIYNAEDNSAVSLIDMMGQKLAIKMTPEDLDKEAAETGDVEVVHLDETKDILGYSCKKALVKVKDSGDEFEVYYTEELSTGIENHGNPMFKDIKGMMMEFVMEQNGMKMHFLAVSVDKKKVSKKDFEVPEGYEEITEEEMQSRFGM